MLINNMPASYSWMTEKEQEEYLLGGKSRQEAAAAQTAAWLRGELNMPQEDRYLASQYNMQPTKNSLANTTRPLKDLAGHHTSRAHETVKSYAGDYTAKAQEYMGNARDRSTSPEVASSKSTSNAAKSEVMVETKGAAIAHQPWAMAAPFGEYPASSRDIAFMRSPLFGWDHVTPQHDQCKAPSRSLYRLNTYDS